MAKKRKKVASKAEQSKDYRWRKIFGLTVVLISLFFLVSFMSYLLTWEKDQDKVLHFSWTMLFNGEVQVANHLGKLGAYLSNLFIYWGFGMASFLLIPFLFKFGYDLIRAQSLKGTVAYFKFTVVSIALLSIFLDFIFMTSHFTYGGVFGDYSVQWLVTFLGRVGLGILFLFIFLTVFTWLYNPSLETVSIPGGVQFNNFKRPSFGNLFQKRSKSESTSQSIPYDKATKSKDEEKQRVILTEKKAELQDTSSLHDSGESTGDLSFELETTKPPKAKVQNEPKDTSRKNPLESLEISSTPVQSELRAFDIAAETQEDLKLGDKYDATADLSRYESPPLELLSAYENKNIEIDRRELETYKDQIVETLANYKIQITKISATIGPTVTLYEIVPAPGVKISKIKNLEDDIALSLAALGIRIIAPIPGKGTIGIEVPNKDPQIVSLREVLQSEKFQNTKMALPIALGKTISNDVFVADLAKMPHLLVAGATGQGKSVGINTILMSLLYKKHPSQVKLVLVDPKKVELFPYSSILNHFLAKLPNEEEAIITDTQRVVSTLNSLCVEMDKRYELLKKARVRNIREYNEKFVNRKLNPNNGHEYMPFIVLVIDEFADLIMTAGKEVEQPIARLAQLARAIGIHLIIATQRPSVNILTGIIKANFPARLAFKVTSKIDSRTILDQGGADQLIGRGDMLLSAGGNTIRLQCAFVDTPEVESVLQHIAAQQGYPEPFQLPEFDDGDHEIGNSNIKLSDLDEMVDSAARLVITSNSGSTSMLQRKFQLGYNRAGRIMDQLEALNVVGPANGSKPREVYMTTEYEWEHRIAEMKKL